MPYIKKEDRKYLDRQIGALSKRILTEGELNYVISQLAHQSVKTWGLGYANLNKIIGVLECAKIEFYRRVVVPYEDMKRRENGDVF